MRNTFVSDHLNAHILYGGMHVRRVEVIRHLRSHKVAEQAIGYFTFKPDIELTSEEADTAKIEWERSLRIEALEAEGMTRSDAQAVLMAEEMGAYSR